jgi:hypothetical protein
MQIRINKKTFQAIILLTFIYLSFGIIFALVYLSLYLLNNRFRSLKFDPFNKTNHL